MAATSAGSSAGTPSDTSSDTPASGPVPGAASSRTDRRERALLAATVAGLAAGAAGAALGRPGLRDAAWAATTVAGLVPAAWYSLQAARRGRVAADTLALAALAGTLAVGELVAGAVVAVMLASGRALEARAEARAERDLRALVGRTPRVAHRREGAELVDVPVDRVQPGDLLLVKPGEVVAVDGRVEQGAAVLDESALTGESHPVERGAGADVRSGVVNAGGPFELRATTAAADSTYAGIVRLVRSAQATSAPFVRMADRVSGAFLALSFAAAGAAWLVTGDPVRAVAVLVVATPCPLVLAAPVAIVAGLARAARAGVVVKGGAALERLADARVLLFDKTGTLTAGRPELVAVHTRDAGDEAGLVRLAAAVEQVSPHVLAGAVVRAARARGLDLPVPADATETTAQGIRGTVDGHDVRVGKLAWVTDGGDPTAGDPTAGERAAVERAAGQAWGHALRRRADRDGRLLVFVAVDGTLAGALALEDPIRPDTARTLRTLRADGFERLVMVTGDRDDTARAVAAVVGLDDVLSERSPAEKVDAVRVERAHGPTVMVGDGLNDAAALATADVGVALGARGASATSETADVVVMVDRIDRLGDARRAARRSQRIARQSVGAGMALSVVAMGAAAFGWLPPTAGAVLQEAIDVAVIVNALRALRPDPRRRTTLAGEDRDLARRFRDEHLALRPRLDHLLAVADRIGIESPQVSLALVRDVHRFLVDDLLPHEQAEDGELYPALARVLGGDDPTGTMSRGHAEIAHLTHRLGRLLDDVATDDAGGLGDAGGLSGDDATDARRLLYGLHAVLGLHFSQEDEGYLSLVDDDVPATATGTATGTGTAPSHQRARTTSAAG